jgi:4-hydroxybenzoate polyprenyltransferase
VSAAQPTPDPLVATPARRAAGRVVGPLLPYVLHLRPAEWPVISGHLVLGWLLAAGLRWPDGHAILGMAAWVIGLSGGTLALNSAYDHDDGDIAYLRQPPPAPTGLAIVGLGLMAIGFVATWDFGPTWRVVYGVCALMSIAYSVPPMRLKRVGGVDWLINVIGFGTLTIWAGWEITGRPLELNYLLIFLGFAPLFGALYPLTQLYQVDSDRARGDRTLAVRLGVSQSLRLSILLMGAAFAVFVGAARQSVWPSVPWLRWAVIGVAFFAWLAVLLPWQREGAGWSSTQHQRGMYHALTAWVLTDIAILLAWVA